MPPRCRALHRLAVRLLTAGARACNTGPAKAGGKLASGHCVQVLPCRP